MVKHHVLIGLGLKRQNFRNRALKYMVDRNIIGSSLNTMRLAVMPPSYQRPTVGRGPLPVARAPLKFNY